MNFFIFAGELSADLHGGSLVKSLKVLFSNAEISGVAGPHMRAQEVEGPLVMEDFCIMGFSDVIRNLPRMVLQFCKVRDFLLETQPDFAIFIDSPSFSLRMAKSLRRRGFKGKIVQYICPTVWAWNKKRIPQMAKTLDLLMTIYPFEPQCFSQTDLKAIYVGNPLQEAIRNHAYDSQWKRKLGLKPSMEIIALFPGSRTSEIYHNLPTQLKAAMLVRKRYPNSAICISCANKNNQELIQQILQKTSAGDCKNIFLIPKEYSYDLMRSSRCAIAKSGTVTLELALHHCPTVVTFQMSWLNMMIAKYLLRINLPFYCIVNILKNERVFPELITEGYSPENISKHLVELHAETPERARCIAACDEVRQMLLSERETSNRCASAIKEMIRC